MDLNDAASTIKNCAKATMAVQGGPLLLGLEPHPILEDLLGQVRGREDLLGQVRGREDLLGQVRGREDLLGRVQGLGSGVAGEREGPGLRVWCCR